MKEGLLFSVPTISNLFADLEIIAHRGASADAPENTLAAMRLAWEQGADAIELDLWLSKDGEIIVFHDDTTKRFESPARAILSLTGAEAASLNVGGGQHPPKLEGVLATVPKGKRAVIELKSGPEIVAALCKMGLDPESVSVISFHPDALAAVKKELPELRCYLLSSWDKKTPWRELLTKVKAAGLEGVDLDKDWSLTAADVRAAHDVGLEVIVWTVDDVETARRWISRGVDGITTNRPAALRRELGLAMLRLPRPEAGALRVMTYNILGGRNTDGRADPTLVTTVLSALNADLVALQEVDKGTARSGKRDLPKEFEVATGWRVIFGEAIPCQGGAYGGALLSRLPVERHSAVLLPVIHGGEVRVLVQARCRFDGRQLDFLGVHLDHLRDGIDRTAQAERVAALYPTQDSEASILAGDWNAPAGDASLRALHGVWTLAGGEKPTWPSWEPTESIDHIFLHGPWKVTRAFRADEAFPENKAWTDLLRRASDHLPVVAELEWRA